MPDISQIFASRWLSSKALADGEMLTLTIKSVSPQNAKAEFGENGAEVKATWVIRFHEITKMLELKPQRAMRLAGFFGTGRTEDWIGRRFCVIKGKVMFGSDQVDGLILERAHEHILPPQPYANAQIKETGRTIPMDAVDRFRAHAAKFGGGYEPWLRWLKKNHQGAAMLAFGVDLDALDMALVPYMKKYLDELAAPPEEPVRTQPADMVVLPTSRAEPSIDLSKNAARPTPAQVQHMQEQPDDIPF